VTEALAWWPADMPLAGYAAIGVLVLIGAVLQGVGGIGFAMFAAPVAVLVAPVMVPGPLLLLGGLVSVMAAQREPKAIDWVLARRCIGGRVAGAALAVAVMLVLPPRPLAVTFAVMLLVAVGLSLAGWRFEPNRPNAWIAGVLSGLMGTITSVGAPPLGLLTQRLPPATIRATIGCVIALGAAASLVLLSASGLFGVPQLVLGLALFPWVWVGFKASGPLARRIPAQQMRRLLLALVAGSALVVLGKAAAG
jgi:uncharacterized membrane protein YfcA